MDEKAFSQHVSGSHNIAIQGDSNLVISISQSIHPRTVDAVAAKQKLASLPLDIDPQVGDVPAHSRLIFLANGHFCGRASELRTLATLLKEPDRKNLAITGIGGIGKTQLASHFVHCYGRYFEGGVFWLNFADENTSKIEIAQCCAALQSELPLVETSSLSLDEQVQLIRTRWQEPLPRLLIFDNCDDEDLFIKYRPPTGGCRVLITSRRAIWTPELGVEVLHLGEFSPEESVEFLRQSLPGVPDADLRAVADELGHLPLALQLASHFLKAYQLTTTAGTYVEELRKEQTLQHASLQGKGSTTSPTAHILHVQQTFATSYRRLEPTDPCDQLARILLKRASYLAPGVPIPTSLLFAKQSQTREEGLQPPTEDEEDDKVWEDALTRLINLGLLETLDNQSVRLHHLLASFVQEQVMPDEVEIQKFVEQVILQKVTEAIDKAAFPAILALQPHFRVVTDRSVNRGDLTAASLCHLLGVCLQMIGAYREAQSYLQHAVHIREQVLGADDPEVGKSLNQLARLYLVQGRYEEAERLFQRAIQILERAAGGEHLEVVECQHNLATLYFEQGRYEEAKVLYQQVISIRERVRGRVHSDVAAKCFQDDYAA